MNPPRIRLSSSLADVTDAPIGRSGTIDADPGPLGPSRSGAAPEPVPAGYNREAGYRAPAARGKRVLRRLFRLVPAVLLAVGAPVSGVALASEQNGYSMEILVDGVPVRELPHGTTYIEATPGREYSVRLTNHTGARVAIALAVDGLNSIDAKTTGAREASKWILGPWESITIDGWQTSLGSARRFFFTTEDRSYGAWLGKTRNLGVISAAVFRERPRIPIYSRVEPQRYRPGSARDGSADPSRSRDDDQPNAPRETAKDSGRSGASGGESDTSPQAAAPAGAPAAQREASTASSGDARRADAGSPAESSTLADRKAAKQALSDELAATGIGRELSHPVERVAFDAENSPAAVLELRYEYREALVRLGVLRRPPTCGDDPIARREDAHGFPDEGFAPDPYRRGR